MAIIHSVKPNPVDHIRYLDQLFTLRHANPKQYAR